MEDTLIVFIGYGDDETSDGSVLATKGVWMVYWVYESTPKTGPPAGWTPSELVIYDATVTVLEYDVEAQLNEDRKPLVHHEAEG